MDVSTAGTLQCNERVPCWGQMCSDCTWSGEKQSPFPPPWHLGQVMRSPCPPPTPLQQQRGFRVQLQSRFSNRLVLTASAAERKLPLGVSSLSKENGPRPVRSYEGCAGTGAGEEMEMAATLGRAAARSGAVPVMQPFARPQCVVPGWPALPRPFPSRGGRTPCLCWAFLSLPACASVLGCQDSSRGLRRDLLPFCTYIGQMPRREWAQGAGAVVEHIGAVSCKAQAEAAGTPCHTSAHSFSEAGLIGNAKVQSNSMISAVAISCTAVCTQCAVPAAPGLSSTAPRHGCCPPTYPQEAQLQL